MTGTPGAGRSSLPELHTSISRLQVFRYSATTWNSHRIHYDPEYARQEGYPDVLVQSHLHAALLARYCRQIGRSGASLQELAVSVRRYAVAGAALVCRGEVVALEPRPDGDCALHLDVCEVREDDEVVCATGRAWLRVPAGWAIGTLTGTCPLPPPG